MTIHLIVLYILVMSLGVLVAGHSYYDKIHTPQNRFEYIRADQKVYIEGGGFFPQGMPGPFPFIVCGVIKDPTPYQLLCANCNWIKRYTHNEK